MPSPLILLDHPLIQHKLSYLRSRETTKKVFKELVDEIAAVLEVPAAFSVAWVGEPCRISTRRAPLEQVLRNLVDNAIKHHDRALGCVEVAGRRLDDEWIEIEVRDDGPGIAPELRERCFGLFRSMSKQRGTGIGLALVKRVVESHGGRVSIEDNAPRGAILRLVWPVGR